MWFLMFSLSYLNGMSTTLNNYVLSKFSADRITGVTSTISSIVAALVQLPYSKLIDVWGRPQGFAVMVVAYAMGCIMMAGCKDAVTFLVAQIFYFAGYTCVQFTVTIFVADTISLRNRAFALAFTTSPEIATAFAAAPSSQKLYYSDGPSGWRWGYGMWALIIPVVSAPLWGMFYYNDKRAEKEGLVTKEPSGRTWYQSIVHYIIEFDAVGVLILAGGLALFLLGLELESLQPQQWRTPFIIAFLVVGGVLLIAFVLYERFLAPVNFLPWSLLRYPTVIFTYVMVASLYTPFSIWASTTSYLNQMFQLNFNLSITESTYLGNTYTIGSCFWSIVFGIILHFNGRSKWHAVFFGVPMTIFGAGLMIYFTRTGADDGSYLAMCLLFVAVGGGTLVICEQINVMAAAPQRYIASVLAIEQVIAQIGQAVGSAIMTAIWMNLFTPKLQKYLPSGSPVASISQSLTAQLGYKHGSPERIAIERSYSETERICLIVGVCLYVITWVSVLFWNDIDVRKMKKQQDRLF